MTERTKGILGAIVIVACFALLGFLVHEKADGAAVAAISTVTIIVAWLTRSPPPSDKGTPGAGGVVVLCAIATAIVTACAGCGEAQAPRETTRAVVLTVADGVAKADKACASVALATRDLELAKVCAAGYAEARQALEIAEDGVDLWDAAAVENVPCAVKHAFDALDKIVDAIERHGGRAPTVVADARKLASGMAGSWSGCRV